MADEQQRASREAGPGESGGNGGFLSHSEKNPPSPRISPQTPPLPSPVPPATHRAPVRMTAMALPTQDQVTDALRAVIDPELRRSIVDLGMVRSIDVQETGKVEVVVSLTTPGLSDPLALPAGGRTEREPARGSDRGRRRLRRAHARREGTAAAGARSPRRAARGRPGGGQERDLRRLGQGRRRQVDDDRQPRGRAAGRGPRVRRARRRRLRLLDPAHARRRPAPRGQRRAQDRAAHRARRDQGDVDRLLLGAKRGGRLARADAAQGDPAVPRGRRLGGARLPAARPASGHRATSR